ncbi:MAG: carbohydrate kinase [Prolixibacteraceae bacterium]|nr:carbohydrate kinase [Prolixibacteraceae bacterium]
MKSGPVICFGEVLWDMLPAGPQPGGALLNVAIHLKQHGQTPILISKIGNDKRGKELLKFLKGFEINTHLINTDQKLPTSEVLIHLNENKNAIYEICEPVAWDNIQFDDLDLSHLNDVNLIIYGSLALRNHTTRNTLFQLLDQSKALRLCDLNLRPPYHRKEIIETLLIKSDFIKLNDDELKIIAEWSSFTGFEKELIRLISVKYNCPSVCVTRGKNGAVLYYHNQFYEHPGFKVDVVDTVGAGDSFLASLVSNLTQNVDPRKALEKACATGAFVTSKSGAVPKYSISDINSMTDSKK